MTITQNSRPGNLFLPIVDYVVNGIKSKAQIWPEVSTTIPGTEALRDAITLLFLDQSLFHKLLASRTFHFHVTVQLCVYLLRKHFVIACCFFQD